MLAKVLAESFGVAEEWVQTAINRKAKALVVVGLNGEESYWPRYYFAADEVPTPGQKLGGMKYAHTVVPLGQISGVTTT